MRLFYSPTSPYRAQGASPAPSPPGWTPRSPACPPTRTSRGAELLAANPLSRVPCLVTEDGLALYDSPVICEYLDETSDRIPLFPPKGAARWRALKLQAMGDGIMDAAVARRGEAGRPREAARDAVMARHAAAVSRTLDALEADVPPTHLDIGTITVACALGYLDLRFPEEPWRDAHPRLAAWFEAISREECLARTAPQG